MSGPVKSNPLLALIDEHLRLQNCFEDLFSRLTEAARMTTLQKLVLFAVFDAEVPQTVPRIGRELGHSRQVIQRIVNELVDEGILRKAPNPQHKRAMLLVPTDKAVAIKRQAEKRAYETAEAFLEAIDADRCETLISELQTLRQAIEAYIQHQGKSGRQTGAADRSKPNPMALLERFI